MIPSYHGAMSHRDNRDGPPGDRPKEQQDDETLDREAPSPSQDPRQHNVRKMLREMYGDDSAETVRRFLYELTSGDDETPPN